MKFTLVYARSVLTRGRNSPRVGRCLQFLKDFLYDPQSTALVKEPPAYEIHFEITPDKPVSQEEFLSRLRNSVTIINRSRSNGMTPEDLYNKDRLREGWEDE